MAQPLKEIDMIKPVQDNRKYYSAKLENEMEVLIIQDVETKKASASLSVGIGAMLDPKYAQGLAHFLEHMLFMGSKKYPSTSHFAQTMAKYQGSWNAFTDGQETNYFFSCNEDGFMETLDVWSQFFIEPILDQSAVFKEVNAVNSEFENKQTHQSRAQLYSLKLLVDKKHPYCKFQTGSIETLRDQPILNDVNIIKELRQFYDSYYSSNIMKLTIITNRDAYEFFPQIRDMFQVVENKHIDVAKFDYHNLPIFRNEQYMVKYITRKAQLIKFDIYFEIHFDRSLTNTKSIAYILELLNNNGKESLKSYLEDQNYVSSFSVSVGLRLIKSLILNVNIELTEEGYIEIEKVTSIFFSYIEQLKNKPLDQKLYSALKKKNHIIFQYQLKDDHAPSFSSSMQQRKMNSNFLYEPFDFQAFNQPYIRTLLNQINKDKAQYTLGHYNFEFKEGRLKKHFRKLKHKYLYQVHRDHFLKYQLLINPLHVDILNTTIFNVTFSDSFIPKELELIPQKQSIVQTNCTDNRLITKVPELINQTNFLKIWHLKETAFQLPEQIISINYLSTISYQNATQSVLNNLLVSLMELMIKDKLYEVYQSDIYTIKFDSSYQGIKVYFQGHQDFLVTIIKNFFSKIQNYTMEDNKFNQIKTKYIKKYNNFKNNEASSQSFDVFKKLMLNSFYLNKENQDAIQNISLNDLNNYKKLFFNNLIIEVYCTGNIIEQNCIDVIWETQQFIKYTEEIEKIRENIYQNNIKDIQNQKEQIKITVRNKNKNDNNHAILYYIQYGVQNYYDNTIFGILGGTLRSIAFEYLRSEKQLGYMINSRRMQNSNVNGYIIAIQGVNSDVQNYHDQIKICLENQFSGFIYNMTQHQLSTLKKSYTDQIREKFKSLRENYEYYFSQINNRQYNFYNLNQILDILDSLQLENIYEFYENLISKGVLIINIKNHKEFQDDDKNNQTIALIKINQIKFYNQPKL